MKITVRNDNHLKDIAAMLRVEPKELAKVIIKIAIDIKVIEDDKEFCGSLLFKEFKNYNFNLIQATTVCLNKHDPFLLADFRELTIWGIHDDCPNCGFEMDFTDEGKVGRFIWHERTCLNCGKVVSNEPDWDTVPGGHDNRNNF
jgi:hypothetical protein